jgi:hypothetical protein
MSTFTSILNRDCEGLTTFELGCSFSGSFLDSFSGSPLSPYSTSDPVLHLEPPASPNGSIFLTRVTMRRDILQDMSTISLPSLQISPLLDLKGCYEQTCWSWLGICDIILKPIHGSLKLPTNTPKKILQYQYYM